MRYVAGLLFDADADRVALVRKNRPAWQAGRLNAIGGKIEAGEEPFFAMCREFREEAGVDITSWSPVAILAGPDFEVHFFATFDDAISEVRTVEDEEIVVVDVTHALTLPHLIPNLRVIIPLALDNTGIVKPVLLADVRSAA